MIRRPGRALAAVSGALALTMALTACSSGGGDEPGTADDPYLPTESPSVTVTMLSPPADYSTVSGEGFSISAPGEFQQRRLTSADGEPMLVLEKPSSIEAIPQRVAVIRDVDPQQSAAEQSFALESVKAAGGPGGEAERSQIDVPGDAGPAFLITWKEERPAEGASTVQVTYWQLMEQVGKDLIINVVAFAPTSEFETSEVSKILRTFVADDSQVA